MRTYAHLVLGRTCEAPGCSVRRCAICLTNEGRNAVRACCEKHAQEAEQHLRAVEAAAERQAA